MARSDPTAPKVFACGPFNGVRNTREPFDDQPNLLQDARNVYFPDTENGCAAYTRGGFTRANRTSLGLGNHFGGFGAFTVIAPNGQPFNAMSYGGVVLALDPSSVHTTTSYSGVLRNTYYNELGSKVYFTQLATGSAGGAVCIVTDGSNKPWYFEVTGSGTISGSGTSIEYNTPTTILSASNTAVAYTAFTYTYNESASNYIAHPTNKTAGTVALAAGTIPLNQWGIYRVYINKTGTVVCLAGAANFTTGYASEALAIAAKPALPLATDWDMGYLTVKTAVGFTFVGGTDALAGGVGGNPASATNYYAPAEGTPWSAYGKPTVYQGSLFFIVNTVGTGTYRTSITWSEPNQPTVGYQQSDYDNTWTLTQAGVSNLFAIVGTNVGLYYARQRSWGYIAGTPSVNFEGSATGDTISENIGCVAPATVATFGNYIYFCDQSGRPYRFAFGGRPEPLWLQMRQDYDDLLQTTPNAIQPVNVERWAWGTFNTNINAYVCAPWQVYTDNSTVYSGPQKWYAFDGTNGRYMGYWALQLQGMTTETGVPSFFGAMLQDDKNQEQMSVWSQSTTGGYSTGTSGALWVQPQAADLWEDEFDGTGNSDASINYMLTSPRLGYSVDAQYGWTAVRAIGYTAGTNSTVTVTGTSSKNADVSLGTMQFLPSTVNPDGIRRQVLSVGNLNGAGLQVKFAQGNTGAVGTSSADQVEIFRIEAEGVPSFRANRDDIS